MCAAPPSVITAPLPVVLSPYTTRRSSARKLAQHGPVDGGAYTADKSVWADVERAIANTRLVG
jgi:hypothetical protein